MKKFVLILILFPSILLAQPSFPSYKQVVVEFITHYSYSPEEPIDEISFAKKNDGWHLQLVDRMRGKIKWDQLYWSAQNNIFLPLTGMDAPAPDAERESVLTSFLEGGDSFRFYGYERCRYYGYNHWSEDMIRDFGNGNKGGYSDTLLEGLARAYSAYASKFLWYQYGGEEEHADTMNLRLAPLQKPSRQRVDSVNYYLGKAIETYKVLAAKNNKYVLLVGNSAMKVFNEQMNGYMQMAMAGFDSAAKKYILSVEPNPVIENIAKNYLNNCAPNAILFASGDNDTYPLWYVQQAKGFRKDVAVINLSLLGLPAYIDMLKANRVVNFTTGQAFYGDSTFAYFARVERDKPRTTLAEFIKLIQTKAFPEKTDFYGMMATYPQSEIILTVDLVKFKKIAAQPNFQPRIKLKLGDYMFNSDFMVLDIINSNLYTRPVYFASDHELFADYLQIQGLVNQFLPLDPRMDDPAVSIAKTKKYLHKIYKTTPSNDFSSGLVPDITNDGMAYNLYGYVARSYLLRKEVDSAVYTIDQLFKAYNNNLPFTLNQNHIAAVLLDAGHVTEGTKLLMDYIETMYQLYRKPSSNSPYISRKTVLDRAVAVQAILLDKKLDTKRIDEILGALERELY